MIKIIRMKDIDLHEIGNQLEIGGVFYTSDDRDILIMLPKEVLVEPLEVIYPSLDEWQSIIRQSDLKEVRSKDQKIILRKSTRQIDTKIMWEVYRRDVFTCRYCNTSDVPMTVDHVVTWEEGGPSIPMNLLTSCKKCNNKRGNMDYEDWLKSPKYLNHISALSHEDVARNATVIAHIPEIRKHHLRPIKKSR